MVSVRGIAAVQPRPRSWNPPKKGESKRSGNVTSTNAWPLCVQTALTIPLLRGLTKASVAPRIRIWPPFSPRGRAPPKPEASKAEKSIPSVPRFPTLPDAYNDDGAGNMTASRPSRSRENSASNLHRPLQPSALRQSHTPPVARRAHSQGSNVASRRPMVDGPAGESMPLVAHAAHPGACNHGTFSPRPSSPTNGPGNGDAVGSAASVVSLESAVSHLGGTDDWKRWLKARMRTKKMGQSSQLAQQAGFRFTPLM